MRSGKVLVIQQYFGLGDIIFCQKIANDFLFEGYKVIWPALPHLVEGLNRAYPDVYFIDHTKFLINYENRKFEDIDGVLHLPMRYSESLMGRPYEMHMVSKYDYLGKDWRRWTEAPPVISRKKSGELFKHLNLSPMDKYNFIATNFGNSGRSVDISISNGHRNVYLHQIDGYSLFDWVPVMQCAKEIHAVSSSTLYLFELFCHQNADQPIHLYVRKPAERDFKYVDFIFTREYILHL